MNKQTWWIIALVIAIAFTLLATLTEQGQVIVQEVVKVVKVAPATTGDVASGDVAEVVTGEVAPTEEVVPTPAEEVAPGADEVAPQ